MQAPVEPPPTHLGSRRLHVLGQRGAGGALLLRIRLLQGRHSWRGHRRLPGRAGAGRGCGSRLGLGRRCARQAEAGWLEAQASTRLAQARGDRSSGGSRGCSRPGQRRLGSCAGAAAAGDAAALASADASHAHQGRESLGHSGWGRRRGSRRRHSGHCCRAGGQAGRGGFRLGRCSSRGCHLPGGGRAVQLHGLLGGLLCCRLCLRAIHRRLLLLWRRCQAGCYCCRHRARHLCRHWVISAGVGAAAGRGLS